MTRTVLDAAIVLEYLAAPDDEPGTHIRPVNWSASYSASLSIHALQGKRIGIEASYLQSHEGVDVLLQTALDQLRQNGAAIVEVNLVERLKAIGDSEYKVLQYEFKEGVNRYLVHANARVKSLKDVIMFNTTHADKAMPYFRQEILESSEQKAGLESEDYRQALQKILSVSRSAIDELFREHNLASIIGPASGPSWCTDLVNGDSFSGYGMSTGPAIAGYPSITVPMGNVHSLPVGLTFIGKPYQEAELLSLAYAYEQFSSNRRIPELRKLQD
jgi:amidase